MPNPSVANGKNQVFSGGGGGRGGALVGRGRATRGIRATTAVRAHPGLQEAFGVETVSLKQIAERALALAHNRQQKVLGADVAVLPPLRLGSKV